MLHKYLFLFLLLLGFTACDDEQILPALEEAPVPSELSLDFVMDAENPGDVIITPGGVGVTLFNVDFGDGGQGEDMLVGGSVTHNYAAGDYSVTLTATGINGQTATLTESLTVATSPPANLAVSINATPGTPLSINVSATADFATGFNVYFGDEADEMPTALQVGATVSHLYAAEGDYEVRVVALSEGMETTLEETQTVNVSAGGGGGGNSVTLPLNFENADIDFGWGGFGGANAEIITNPDPAGENTSGRVVQLNKTDGSEVWAGAFLELEEAVDFSSSDKLYVNVWSPRAGIPVILKLELADDADTFVEVTTNTTAANEWQLLEFDYSGGDLSLPYAKIVIFFDFGTNGMNENFYFDNISLDGEPGGGGGGGGNDDELLLPLDFQAASSVYAFGNFGGASAEVIDNPDASGINTSSQVAASTKNDGSEVWAGVFIDLDEAIDFTSSQTMKLKVWSPVSGAVIMLKLENPDNGDDFIEVMATTTGANQWEELTYDFSGIEAFPNIKRVVLFGNFGTSGTGETYYFDDIRRD